eukprot:CAMPEP_0194578930 /NCGR_PEP_ID=MMETSP0292-20121207/13176_1 /TAXON_ID=39354 /ORGANISM="Heterosigma akashiwo, Strain CCMP2393" /LENGTH=603 /DNA_ID=CAMNT_0039431733 /DNA_START=537 /DNA_END=2348 /DNA_ORIENTATION=-
MNDLSLGNEIDQDQYFDPDNSFSQPFLDIPTEDIEDAGLYECESPVYRSVNLEAVPEAEVMQAFIPFGNHRSKPVLDLKQESSNDSLLKPVLELRSKSGGKSGFGYLPSSQGPVGARPLAVPSFPFQLEPNYHVELKGEIKDTILAVHECTRGFDPSTTYIHTKQKWKVVVNQGDSDPLKVVVRLFSKNSDDSILEVQKRQGESWLFHQFYKELISKVMLKVEEKSDPFKSGPLQEMEGFQIPTLPKFPFQLESLTHFRLKNMEDKRLVSLISSHYSISNYPLATIIHIPGKFKWKVCGNFNNGAYVKFIVRVFKQELEHIVELQRRQGDVCAFQNLFKEAMDAILNCSDYQSGATGREQGRPAPHGGGSAAAAPGPPLGAALRGAAGGEPPAASAVRGLERLFLTVYSPKADVRRETAAAFLALSAADDFITVFCKALHSNLYQIIKLLELKDIQMPMLQCILNLLNHAPVQAALGQDEALFAQLAAALAAALQHAPADAALPSKLRACGAVLAAAPQLRPAAVRGGGGEGAAARVRRASTTKALHNLVLGLQRAKACTLASTSEPELAMDQSKQEITESLLMRLQGLLQQRAKMNPKGQGD